MYYRKSRLYKNQAPYDKSYNVAQGYADQQYQKSMQRKLIKQLDSYFIIAYAEGFQHVYFFFFSFQIIAYAKSICGYTDQRTHYDQ